MLIFSVVGGKRFPSLITEVSHIGEWGIVSLADTNKKYILSEDRTVLREPNDAQLYSSDYGVALTGEVREQCDRYYRSNDLLNEIRKSAQELVSTVNVHLSRHEFSADDIETYQKLIKKMRKICQNFT